MGIRKSDEIGGLRDKRLRDKRVRLYFLNFCFEKLRKLVCESAIICCFRIDWGHRYIGEFLYKQIDCFLVSGTILDRCVEKRDLFVLNKVIHSVSLNSEPCYRIEGSIFEHFFLKLATNFSLIFHLFVDPWL